MLSFPFSRCQESQEKGRDLQVETVTNYLSLVKKIATLINKIYEDILYIIVIFC